MSAAQLSQGASYRQMRVLVVEPDATLARTYVEAFRRAGFEAATARSAQAAVDAADDDTPDCVMLELQLPGHNGVEFLYEFRSYAEWQHVPVILNTFIPPRDLAAVQPALQALGIAAVLYKPQTSLQRLVAATRQVVGEAAAVVRGES